MRFVIFGAGAVGSVIGSHLAKLGHRCCSLGDPPHVEKFKQAGLQAQRQVRRVRHRPPTCLPLLDWQYQPDDVICLAGQDL